MTENILFICGSLNQTTQMHQIAQQMGDYNYYFTPYYADGIENLAAKTGLLDFTVLGGRHQRESRQYLADHQLPVDERGEGRNYDLVVTCSDLIVQKNIRRKRTVLVQEGITEPEGKLYRLYKTFPFLPRYIANTATNGLSNTYDIFCVASQGYAEHFIRKGVRPEKIAVTGIPNFDNLQKHRENTFPERDFVLVATTPYRETLRGDDRMAFLRRCGEIAAARPLIFKLHPTENVSRAKREIKSLFPDATILTHGNVNDMIANAETVVTQQSTCTFVAVALGKETHTYLNLPELRRLLPIQNGGASAHQIANIARRLLHTPMPVLEQVRRGYRARPRWEQA
ncbi:MAG: hypothetical protein EHM81_01900 [Chloroflexi bacterium]|nr:MAG: hypothetical protein EHM81_01900 [Chloroflexota bacterium]